MARLHPGNGHLDGIGGHSGPNGDHQQPRNGPTLDPVQPEDDPSDDDDADPVAEWFSELQQLLRSGRIAPVDAEAGHGGIDRQ